ncbi:MAG: hypothetical protein M3Z84_00965 [Actinomycetota bacterium]|nr:hypothetical protein [Actinomycetota bacterium]
MPPVLAAVLVGAISIVPTLASAEGPPPPLPPVSPQDLLLKVKSASVPGLSGTLRLKSNLGLPSFGQALPLGHGLLPSLLSGDHTAKLWVAGDKVRVAFPTQMAESDIVRSGNDVWLWESDGQRATHLTLDQKTAASPHDTGETQHGSAAVEPTPQALANELLASVDPTTRVFVRDTATVAGRSAYELVLAPRSDVSLVADVVIAVDSATGLPLRVQVMTKDSGTPAFEFGFTSIDFSVPGDSTFAFTPPAGAQVTQARGPKELLLPGSSKGRGEMGGHLGIAKGEPAPDGTDGRQANDSAIQTKGDAWETVVVVTPKSGTAAGGNQTLDMVKKLAKPVDGGRLLHTSLINVLFLDDGRVILGSVTEPALRAAA